MVDFGGSDTKDFEDGNINTGSNLGPTSLLTSADAAILCNSNLIHSNESDKTFRKLILIQSTRIFPFHVKPNQILSIFGKNLETKVRLYGLGQIDRQITSIDQEHLIFWSGDRIDVKIPRNIPPDNYHIMVVKGGASKMAKDKVRINPPYQAYTFIKPGGFLTQQA